MRGLQEEFKTINDDLKASLQSRMKFEIAERIITDSQNFFYLRLFMIQNFQNHRNYLLQHNPESPSLLHLNANNLSSTYKKLSFELINSLEMAHHEPGQIVVMQNEEILDEFDGLKEDASVYFIMTGTYKVQSLMFLMANKRNVIETG